jgi:hypothetical protein
MSSLRASFLALVLQQMHAPYRWNAKGTRDATTGQRLFDCSGLVAWALREVGGPDWLRPQLALRRCGGSSALRGWTRRHC